MVTGISPQKVIAESGVQLKNANEWNTCLFGKHLMEKYQEGHQIHHKDGNKLNNNISNLELVDTLTHKRIHSGCELRNGEW